MSLGESDFGGDLNDNLRGYLLADQPALGRIAPSNDVDVYDMTLQGGSYLLSFGDGTLERGVVDVWRGNTFLASYNFAFGRTVRLDVPAGITPYTLYIAGQSAFDTGSYELLFEPLGGLASIDTIGGDFITGLPIASGQTLASELDFVSDADSFIADVRAGRSYVFAIDDRPNQPPAFVTVKDTNFVALDTVPQDAGDSGVFTAQRTGEVLLTVQSEDFTDTRPYLVFVQETATNRLPVTMGSVISEVESLSRAGELYGWLGDDTLIGSTGADFIFGGAGNDVISGRAARDLIYGEAGNDRLFGNPGRDRLDGGFGNDVLDGGQGIDALIGGPGNDVLITDSLNERILGGPGFDILRSGVSSIDLSRTSGIERVSLTGGADLRAVADPALARNDVLIGNAGDNVLAGYAGNDGLLGMAGDDRLFGGTGNDVLIGGPGQDTLEGGGGGDDFRYESINDSRAGGPFRDVIVGFTSGQDRLNLAAIDADTLLPGNQAFFFIGGAAFSGAGAELRVITFGGNGLVQGDVTGNGLADFEVAINGFTGLTASDILL